MMKPCTDYTNMYLIQCTVMAPLTHAHLHFVKELNTIKRLNKVMLILLNPFTIVQRKNSCETFK